MDDQRKFFLSLAGVLVGFGILMVHSASITSRPSEFEEVYLSRHLIFLVLGVAGGVVAAALPAATWQRHASWMFWLTVLLLVLVLVPGLGTRVNGAQRWFRSGPLSIQPSELAKLTLPIYICHRLQCSRGELRTWWKGLCLTALPVLIVVPLVLRQPDLGTSVFLATGAAIALWVGQWPLRNFVLGAGATLPVLGWYVLHKPYQMQRIVGFLATWSDSSQAPYQLKQSLVTLGAGGAWGVGLGKGFQKLSFLPEANTDFVFAVIGEELGLAGMLALIALWVGLYLIGLRLLRGVEAGGFAYTAGFTLLTQLVLQVALNVAVVTAMVPPKGIPHPLVSYGGSNFVVSLVTLGAILGLTRPEGGRRLVDGGPPD